MADETSRIKEIARLVRIDSIRMTTGANSGHPGGSLSAADIFATLYAKVMRIDPKNPKWEERDRFVLSAGHICPGLYATMARVGYFPVEELSSLRVHGSRLQGHPSRVALPGIEASTGSLGQGISMALGFALALPNRRVYALMGDGEQNEGEVWEAAQAAAHYKVDNLVGIVDWNGVQQDGNNDDVLSIEPLPDKYRAFGWHVIEVDGHNVKELLAAFDEAAKTKGKPTVLLARTVMGKGVSFMEGRFEYHGKPLSKDEAQKAIAELESHAR